MSCASRYATVGSRSISLQKCGPVAVRLSSWFVLRSNSPNRTRQKSQKRSQVSNVSYCNLRFQALQKLHTCSTLEKHDETLEFASASTLRERQMLRDSDRWAVAAALNKWPEWIWFYYAPISATDLIGIAATRRIHGRIELSVERLFQC